MTALKNFSTRRFTGGYDPDSPIKGDLRLVACILQGSVHNFATEGLEALKNGNLSVVTQLKAATDAVIGITSSIAINLPVELQRAFLDAAGMPEDLAETMLAKMRSEAAKL